MTTKERMAALIDNNDDAAEALADLGFIPKASQPQRVDFDYEAIAKGLGLSAEQVGGDYAKINFLAIGSALEQKGFSRAKAEDKQMFDMCALAGAPEMAGPVMEQAKSIDAARELILNEKAVIDSKSSITSTISGDKPQNDFVSFMQKQHAPAQA